MDDSISFKILLGISNGKNQLDRHEVFFRVSPKQNFKKIIEILCFRHSSSITSQHYFSLEYNSDTSFADLGFKKKDGNTDYNIPDNTVSIVCITDDYKNTI